MSRQCTRMFADPWRRAMLTVLTGVALSACGGGGGGSGSSGGSGSGSEGSEDEESYLLTATLSGLSTYEEVTARVNGDTDNSLVLDDTANNKPSTFPEELADGTEYEVTIADQPEQGQCTVSNATGVIDGSDVGDIDVRCGPWAVVSEYDAPGANRFNDVIVTSADNAVAVGKSNLIWRTEDGGDNWQIASKIPDSSNFRFTGVTFDEIVDRLVAVSEGGHILRSETESGDSWEEANTVPTSGTENLRAVTSADQAHGWAVGETIVHTSNDGYDWEYQTSNLSTSSSADLNDVDFADDRNAAGDYTGIIVGGVTAGVEAGGMIQRTDDGGENWEEVDVSTHDPGVLHGVWLSDDGETAWAVGDNGTVLHSDDGGVSWTPPQTEPTDTDLNDVVFVENDPFGLEGWIVGDRKDDDPTILHTTDDGTNWSRQGAGVATVVSAIDMFDPDTGFAVGYRVEEDGTSTEMILRYEE